jgi:hypothetical protein
VRECAVGAIGCPRRRCKWYYFIALPDYQSTRHVSVDSVWQQRKLLSVGCSRRHSRSMILDAGCREPCPSHTYSTHLLHSRRPDVQAAMLLSSALCLSHGLQATARACGVVPYWHVASTQQGQHPAPAWRSWSAFPTRMLFEIPEIINPADPVLTILRFCSFAPARLAHWLRVGATEARAGGLRRGRRFRRTPKKTAGEFKHCTALPREPPSASPLPPHLLCLCQWLLDASGFPCPVDSRSCCSPIISVSASS